MLITNDTNLILHILFDLLNEIEDVFSRIKWRS